MPKPGQRVTEGLIDLDLTGCVVKVIISSKNMGDAHGSIIDYHGEIIGWKSITPEDDQVVELRIVKLHPALNQVLHDGCPFVWRKKADGRRSLRFRRFPTETGPVVPGFGSGL
jgi:hypothetical protein